MPYGTLNTGTITPGSGNTLTINEIVDGTAIKDQDNMSSNSATHLATQQSIKAYTDTAGTNSSITTLGTVTAGNLSNTAIVYPAGHILRSFYDESDAALESFSLGSETDWGEMELTITGGGSASDFLQVTVNINGIYNSEAAGGVFLLGVRYSAANGGSWSGTTLGSPEYYTRTMYIASATGLNMDTTIVMRAAHPSTSTYYVRPRIFAQTTAFNVNQAAGRSTITAHEIKG